MAAAGFTVVPWDFIYGNQFDLLQQQGRKSLLRLCLSADCVHMGMPCETFSRARRSDGRGPPALRNNDNLWGFPDLQGKNLEK
eukprot:9769894-Karenia_brevis.AAC.1